ncbi:MAG: Trehalose synthase [Syntrophorhabdaceae bacterium PtaU1.Bin034]|nr:MAG: Trehalose synthase [Syntrophorhabdaceae bacterium PtaU1.Bin034]
MISRYTGIAPKGDLLLIRRLCDKLAGKTFLHVNSTREGGGVAEILQRMIPLLAGMGIDARWEVIKGDLYFFEITKKIHNALQGNREDITEGMWEHYFEVNRGNAEALDLQGDAVLIHDPQPAPLIEFRKGGHWMWRCHIDVSEPNKVIFDFLSFYTRKYESAIFSISRFAKALGIDEFIIPPSIDPISEKNRELSQAEIEETLRKFGIETGRPILLQVSRFDRFKDPTGVIAAYRMVKRYNDCVLILAGSPATDDPEGEEVLNEVREYATGDPDIRILLLPPFSDKDINALQRVADVILQKSMREGFGLTVSEAMWKGKPVVGGAAGGIPLQIIHGVTGFLVHSNEGAAFRIRQLLNDPGMGRQIGAAAREYVRNNFLITRQMRDYLSVWYFLENNRQNILHV